MQSSKTEADLNKIIQQMEKLCRETISGRGKRSLCDITSPNRLKLLRFVERMEIYMGNSVQHYKKHLSDEGLALTGALYEACRSHKDALNFHDTVILQVMGQDYYQKYIANLDDNICTMETCVLTHMFYYRYLTCGGRYFQTSTETDDLLLKTDISGKYPLKYFKIPYRTIYIECRKERTSPLRLKHPKSGEHIFEGAYISEINHPKESWSGIINNSPRRFKVLGNPTGDTLRTFEVCLIGSPKDKHDLQDDMYHFLSFTITNEEQDLLDLMSQHKRIFTQENPSHSSEYINMYCECLEHIAKVILFLNTNQSSKEEIDEKYIARKQLNKYPSSSIKSKLARDKLTYASKKIYISIQNDSKTKDQSSNESRRGVKTHWRRGHFRFLPKNLPNRQSDKTIWIKPMLINGSVDASPKNKEYVLN